MGIHGTRSTTAVAMVLALPALLLAAACGGGDGDSDENTVEVTGTTSCVDVGDGLGTGEGLDFRDAVYECTFELTDERLMGVVETVNSCDFSEDGETTLGECHGTSVITNDGGTWEGTFTGTTTWSTSAPAHVHHIDLVFIGTGDHAGLRFVAEMDGTDYPWDVVGQVEPADDAGATAAPEVYDIVLLGDTLAQRDWVPVWADLIESDLGVDVEIGQFAVGNPIDYDKVLADQDTRDALTDAEMVFISPEPDYLMMACPPGTADQECVQQFVAEYRASWSQWLDDIQDLSNDAPIRSAKAWAWVVPPAARPAILRFMDEMAEETIENDGLVADLNAVFAGEDYQGDPPPDWIDDVGHPLGPANDIVAELIHGLGDGVDG